MTKAPAAVVVNVEGKWFIGERVAETQVDATGSVRTVITYSTIGRPYLTAAGARWDAALILTRTEPIT